jgi:uncharacterized Fe-S center protein
MESRVFFVGVDDGASSKEQARAMGALFEAAEVASRIARRDLVAIKIHVGEQGNTTHMRPELVRELVQRVKGSRAFPFLTETSTLYKGQRENGIKHILLAHGHGFSIERVGAPFIMADGLVGNTEAQVEIQGELHRTVRVAREVLSADALLVVSHPTGHPGTGMGACLKNLGMGLASRMGKMRQHSAVMPEVISERCQLCKKCQRWCPQGAIEERGGVSIILEEKCIGCGECLAVCRFDAVRYDFGTESAELQRSMVEHAWGAVKDKAGKCFYFNVLVDMTKDCDCFGTKQKKILPDLGILGSEDPVALDAATLEITREKAGKDLGDLSYPHLDPMVQILHAEKLGMGSARFALEKVALPERS